VKGKREGRGGEGEGKGLHPLYKNSGFATDRFITSSNVFQQSSTINGCNRLDLPISLMKVPLV